MDQIKKQIVNSIHLWKRSTIFKILGCLYPQVKPWGGVCCGQPLPELSESRYMLRLYVCYGCMSFCQSIKLLLPICQTLKHGFVYKKNQLWQVTGGTHLIKYVKSWGPIDLHSMNPFLLYRLLKSENR